jgi:hypothetical protein
VTTADRVPPAPADDGRPLLLVWGNCQAESLRLLADAGDVRSVRLPAVHELLPAEVPALHQLVARTDLLVSQPVADGYHELPVGTAQLVDVLPPSARHVVLPIVRYAGLHPLHVVVHPPGLPDPLPPVVPYHDLVVATAAAWRAAGRRAPSDALGTLGPEAVRAIGERSLAELRRREAGLDVPAADLLAAPTFASMRTINHPGNAVLEPLGHRVRAALGLPPRPPGVSRPLLDAVHAPCLAAVAAVHDPEAEPSDDWVVDGHRVPGATVAEAHAAFYDARPDVLAEVLRRSAPERAILALRTPEES